MLFVSLCIFVLQKCAWEVCWVIFQRAVHDERRRKDFTVGIKNPKHLWSHNMSSHYLLAVVVTIISDDSPLVLRSTFCLGATTSSSSIALSDRLSESSSDHGFFFGFLATGLNRRVVCVPVFDAAAEKLLLKKWILDNIWKSLIKVPSWLLLERGSHSCCECSNIPDALNYLLLALPSFLNITAAFFFLVQGDSDRCGAAVVICWPDVW